jgi:hypothetical protein
MKQVMSITLVIFTSSAELGLDKDYRKAVHWLETLRIRRIKTLEGGYNVSRPLCCRLDPMNVINAESTTLRSRGHGTYQECARHVYRYLDVSATRVGRCIS